jgi:hypothetical protein
MVAINGFGDCLFGSISSAMPGSWGEMLHYVLRQALCDHLQEYVDHYIDRVRETLTCNAHGPKHEVMASYTDNLRKPRTFTETLVVQAMSDMLGTHFSVHSFFGKELTVHEYYPVSGMCEFTPPWGVDATVNLGFSESHYSLLCLGSDADKLKHSVDNINTAETKTVLERWPKEVCAKEVYKQLIQHG